MHRQILVDTLVYCGTSPAFNLLREYILKQRITGELAVRAISHLPGTIEAPTVELLDSFFVSLSLRQRCWLINYLCHCIKQK